ncbi:MAG: signal peptidase II [Flavobacteriales bacterium]|nr:signal peptidase II [Flavobacteriales bacterium]
MNKTLFKYLSLFTFLFIIDQYIKYAFVYLNWGYDGPVISLVLAYNYGVAFSMLEFLAEYLKYLQISILLGGSIYLYLNLDVLKRFQWCLGMFVSVGVHDIDSQKNQIWVFFALN